MGILWDPVRFVAVDQISQPWASFRGPRRYTRSSRDSPTEARIGAVGNRSVAGRPSSESAPAEPTPRSGLGSDTAAARPHTIRFRSSQSRSFGRSNRDAQGANSAYSLGEPPAGSQGRSALLRSGRRSCRCCWGVSMGRAGACSSRIRNAGLTALIAGGAVSFLFVPLVGSTSLL